MAPLLSIIIPVYNVEQYLENGINCVLAQTFKDYELILVNDGSTDRSRAICEMFAKKDSRISVINKGNEGAWSARNIGIDKARGKYIMFFDPDDLFGTVDTIEKNIHILFKQKEISLVQFPSFWYKGQKIDYSPSPGIQCYDSYDSIFFALFDSKISTVLWDKIYDKRIFSKVRFPHLRYYEDSYCMIDILMNTESVIISGQGYYKYCIRDGSAMTSNLSVTKIEDYFCMNLRFLNFAQAFDNTDVYRLKIFLGLEEMLAYGKRLLSQDSFSEYCDRLSKYKPCYKSIVHYMLTREFKKGLKVLIIKIIGLKFFYGIKYI